MHVEIYLVSYGRFADMLGDHSEREVILSAAKLCSEIIVGMYDQKPLAYLGISPTTLISSEAYVWMVVAEEGERRPFFLARYAKKTVETVLCKYTRLYGDCFSAKSARWLRSLGAVFTEETKFELRRD